MGERWRVALVDSGLNSAAGFNVTATRCFLEGGAGVHKNSTIEDATGHGTALAEIIRASGKDIEWAVARVFDTRPRSTPASIAAAVRWALSERAQLIHLSLGLEQDRRVLADAIMAAISASVIVVASSPAQGSPTYPASYPGVIRATGDARCGSDTISALYTPQADYGACPQYQSPAGRILRGASIGAAHVSRFIIQHAALGVSGMDLRQQLQRLAAYQGPERRG